MDRIVVWEFHETIKGYYGHLDCEKAGYDTTYGKPEIIIIFEDVYREQVPNAGSFENKYRAKHRYTIRFSGSYCSLRIRSCGPAYNSPINDWCEEGLIREPFHPAFKLTQSEYIDWVNEMQFCGEYSDKLPGLVHYLIQTEDCQIIEVVDNVEPTVEVEYL